MDSERSVADTVATKVVELPPAKQREVLEFVEFLRGKQQPGPTIWDKIEARLARVPEDVLDELPTDGSENLDHYLYGAPKK